MLWTVPKVIGFNVKNRREALGMTAKTLGQKMGEYFPKVAKNGAVEPKPWPTPAVYMMEAGDRAMVAQEVAALSRILYIPIAQLFTPPSDIEVVTVGSLEISSEALSVQGGEVEEQTWEAARSIRAIDRSTKKMSMLVNAQMFMVEDAKNALMGKAPTPRSESDDVRDIFVNMARAEANTFYEDEPSELGNSPSKDAGDPDGEGK
jgi:hypothetical protein